MQSLPLSVYLRSQGRERQVALKDTSSGLGGTRAIFLARPTCPSPAITCAPLRWGRGCLLATGCRCDSRVTRMEQSWGVLRALLSSTGLTFCDFCPQRASPITDGLLPASPCLPRIPFLGGSPVLGRLGSWGWEPFQGWAGRVWGPLKVEALGFPPSSICTGLLHLETPGLHLLQQPHGLSLPTCVFFATGGEAQSRTCP